MYRMLFSTVFLLAFIVAQSEAAVKCPPNESYRECASACEPECGRGLESMMCIQMCMPARCQCSEMSIFCAQGFVRNPATGRCVRPSKCPKCPPNEQMRAFCPPCEPTCQNQQPSCPTFVACNATNSSPKCQCVGGFVRQTEGGSCVPVEQCAED